MSLQRFNLISLHEAIDLLGVSRSTFDRWRKLKQLPFVKIGKEILIDKNELESWVRHHTVSIQSTPAASGGMPQAQSTITIGYQSGTAHMWTALIMKELGWFEEELFQANPIPTQVKWFDAANGTLLLQGLIGGNIQMATLGDYPIALSQSFRQTLPSFRPILLAFDGKTSYGEGISLVIRKGLAFNQMKDICDWSLSSASQSSAGRRLSKLLQKLGGSETHFIHKEMDESMVGIAKGQLAGSMMWEPYVSLAEFHGIGQVLYPEGLGEDYLTGIVADEAWVKEHEGHTIAYLKAHVRVHTFIRNHPQAAAEIISRVKGIPAYIAARIMAKVRWDAAMYTKDMKALQRLDQEHSSTDNVSSSTNEIRFKGEYLQQAIKALKLPQPDNMRLEGEWAVEHLY